MSRLAIARVAQNHPIVIEGMDVPAAFVTVVELRHEVATARQYPIGYCLAVRAVVVVVIVACGGGSKRSAEPVSNEASPLAAAPNTFDARHAQLSSIADQVCACADADCALKAMEPLNTFPMSGAEGETETDAQRRSGSSDSVLAAVQLPLLYGACSGWSER